MVHLLLCAADPALNPFDKNSGPKLDKVKELLG